jgi:Fe2+ transport system protein FeoA/Mn-dependent DtxR family transcriptional regulator
MPSFSQWFWPALSVILAGLWLWTAFRQHRGGSPAARASTPGQQPGPVEAEDALKAAHALQDAQDTWGGEDLARAMGLSAAMGGEVASALVASSWAEKDALGSLRLTDTGEAHARELVRAHRLWERYLIEREGMPLEEIHAEAHRREHETTPEEVEKLDAELGYPAWDPHGHAIPAPGCQVPSIAARSLLEEATPSARLRIVCLDDEPAPLLAQLIAMGLKPGVDVEVVAREPGILRITLNGDTIPLADAAARHVAAVPVPALPVPLGELPVGSRARVTGVQGGGKHERRMLDMGFVPGAEVAVVRRAPLGDPVEYRIKGTAVALRREDAYAVLVEEFSDE